MRNKASRTVCEIISEFAPTGFKGVTKGVCNKVLSSSKQQTYSDDRIVCVSDVNWLGREKSYCVIKEK